MDIHIRDENGNCYTVARKLQFSIRSLCQCWPELTDCKIYVFPNSILVDSKPQFTKKEYSAEIPEKSPAGTTVLQVHAMDLDSGSGGEVSYRLIGSEAFHIDPRNGEITVDKPSLLDRELQPGTHLS
jgi:hypothetical protein